MALGLSNASAGGGNFLPIIKYDARAGRMFRVDREDGVSTPHDITRNFKAVFDFENLEVGYINFDTGTAPDFQMVAHGEPLPVRPSEKHRQGTRMTVKLGKEIGGDCRELAGTANVFLSGIDALHDQYLAGMASNPGKLPVVELTDTIARESGQGAKKSTNYQPIFSIIGWVARPADLKPRSAPVATPAPAAAPAAKTPPATGSKVAAAPKAAVLEEEDFG
jgi:hypothetical protein